MRDQAVPDLVDRLDDLGVLGVVGERSAQMRDRSREHVLGRDAPDVSQELFFPHWITGVAGEAEEHLHDFGLDARLPAGPADPIEPRVHLPGAHPERLRFRRGSAV